MYFRLIRTYLMIIIISFSLYGKNNKIKNDILVTNLAGIALITGWGITNWDYGNSSPHATNEGWFGPQTKYGGADKAGHLYAAYMVGSGLSGLYQSWGYSQQDAALYGSLSSFFLMNTMEIGDAFSTQQGFSYEDFILNSLGSLSSYLFYTSSELSKRVDLRIEYLPSFKTADVVTEYEKMKYVIALKAEGFDCITHPALRYGELHLGYYTRNYKGGITDESERILYVGIGINLSKIARQNGYRKTGTFLNYYQLPYTYIPIENDLNR
ncbi:MAG TPA: DUF2279 domain-containing protein [Sulfuricurvum sp.]|nr:DUF2279 domain-containing protein [Sulfuricurvum sp.]